MLVVILAWTGFVLYPNPHTLAVSLSRLAQPPVDPAAVSTLAAGLPDDPVAVEAFSQGYVAYEYAWNAYGSPWYFPTVTEVVRDRVGDCQAEAILTASILQAKGLPYTFRYSFDHVWVDYPGKAATMLEDPATAFVSNEGEGWFASLPDRIPLRSIVQERIKFHWYPMPLDRKLALLVGLLLTLIWGERLLPPLRRPSPARVPETVA
ncbi:MAG: transglutaminase domain-containing protein [Thermoleophilia bacterium]|nr:transglutaminase domain-containing protein [Thermoleophilia bacterium]